VPAAVESARLNFVSSRVAKSREIGAHFVPI
jgi:hypothetical protein